MESTANASGLVGWLAGNRNRAGLVLMILGVVIGGATAWLASKYGRDYLVVELLLGLIALVTLSAGVLLNFRPPDAGSPILEARVAILALGGMVGLLVTLVGLTLAYQWWPSVGEWLDQGKRPAGGWVLFTLATILTGLVVMFASVQVVKSEERISPVLRRFVYGYNAVLGGILLFLILIVLNVFAYRKLPAVLDSKETNFATLSEKSINILKSVTKPVTAYMMMSTQSTHYEEMRPMLANAQGYCPLLKVESVSPSLNPQKFDELKKDYPQSGGLRDVGVLLVVGEKDKAQVGFIKSSDIIKSTGRDGANFEGESAFITELSSLVDEKKKPVVYFASGNAGEMDYKDSTATNEHAIGSLVRRLGDRNFETKPLRFDAVDPKVPDDATIVVIPGPKLTYGKPAVDALANYMNARKGKLIVLAGVVADRDSKVMPDTGLESLLGAYKVALTKDRILNLPVQGGTRYAFDRCLYAAGADAVRAGNLIVKPFERAAVPFEGVREVKVAADAVGNPALRAETLFDTEESMYVFLDSDPNANARAVCEALIKGGQKAVAERVAKGNLSMAVAVSESATPPPSMPGMPPQRGGESKPRVAVFGNAKWVSNPLMDERGGADFYFQLFVATLDWLREKPANIGVEPKQFKFYSLSPDVSGFRLQWLPLLVALTAVVGLGVGVWVTRRR